MKVISLKIALLTLMAFSLQLKAQEATSLMSGTPKTSIDAKLYKKNMNAVGDDKEILLNSSAQTMTITYKNGSRQEIEMNEIESIEYSNHSSKDMFAAYLSQAGMLSTVLSETKAKNVLEMKLSGRIDARDFDYIKWYCNRIQVIDLKDVVIDAYIGEDGTNEGIYDTFYANKIPTGAFFYWGTSRKHSLTGIPKNEGMTSLKKIILPNNIDSIGEKAFANMAQLESVTVSTPYPPKAHRNSFQGLSRKARLYIPMGTKTRYRSAEGWDEFVEIVEVNESGTPIISDNPLIGTWKTTRIEGWGESVSTAGLDYLQLKADGTYIHVEEEDGIPFVTRGTWTTSEDKFILHKKDGGQSGPSFEYEIIELKDNSMKVSMWRVIAYLEKVQDSVIKQYQIKWK
ncbi:lipocalin family protein [Prevotella sp. ne3005]|uniref:lipocalin family protein n=1 Tax=Prevotella sp. ne3005 TaxID=1761887 RepID=UPI000B813BBC|nr:lipocalin family protein [Prevotella sp. ne3005]